MITTDTCNTARKLSRLLVDKVVEAAQTKLQAKLAEGEVVDESQLLIMRADCHHHLRNIWIGAIVIRISKHLNNILSLDLANINFRYRVTTKMDAVLRCSAQN